MPNNLVFTATDINSLSGRVGSLESRFDLQNCKFNKKGTVVGFSSVASNGNSSLKIYAAHIVVNVPVQYNQDIQLDGDTQNAQSKTFSFGGVAFSTPPAVTVSVEAAGKYWATVGGVDTSGCNIYLHTTKAQGKTKVNLFPKTATINIIAIGY